MTLRIGILVTPPPPFILNLILTSTGPTHSWVWSLIIPPKTSLVFNIVNNHWETHQIIRIHCTGPYFIFECENLEGKEAINTTIIDGKPITFSPFVETQIHISINFNMARIWVRLCDLPFFYDPSWTVRILNHVEEFDSHGPRLPLQHFLRARLVIDLSQSLTLGCFIPINEHRVAWVFFLL